MNRTLTFTPGVTSQLVSIPAVFDGEAEGDETVLLILADPENALVGGSSPAVLTISDAFKIYLPLVICSP